MTSTQDQRAAGYDENFYAGKDAGSYRSATVILPIVFAMFNPRSIVDVGCGTGTWLRAADELGVHDYFGYDGSHVRQLQIPRERFAGVDLSRPLQIERRFDLAVSCEVAEHLPAASAETFIATLTSLSDVILFSAAIPGQGGVQHVNEQWPAYWQVLFRAKDYSAYDIIRPRVWNDARIEWWYRQNTVVYVANGAVPRFSLREPTAEVLSLVHPAVYEAQRPKRIVRNILRNARRALARISAPMGPDSRK